MRDFFPPPPLFLIRLSSPLATYLSLHTLPNHTHEILLSFLFYHTLNKTISPRLSAYFFPKTYPNLRSRTKVSWDAHVVSFVQACVINSLALAVLFFDQERRNMNAQERLWGYTGASGMVQGFAAGYFVWDLWTAVFDFDVHGIGTVVHAVCALAVSGLGYRPFANYYGVPFVLYELSTPFLNIHWFMDKLNLTGSRAQWINGVALMFTFFVSRLVWGSYYCFLLIWDVWGALKRSPFFGARVVGGKEEQLPIPPWLGLLYVTSMLALSVLNMYWFGRMVRTVLSRFEGEGQGQEKTKENGRRDVKKGLDGEKVEKNEEKIDKNGEKGTDKIKNNTRRRKQEGQIEGVRRSYKADSEVEFIDNR